MVVTTSLQHSNGSSASDGLIDVVVKAVIEAVQERELDLEIVHCTAGIEVLRDRLNNRTGDIADATADLLAAQVAQFAAFTPEEQPWVRQVDTSQGGDLKLQ